MEFKHAKYADISGCHRSFSFSHKMTSEEKAQKFYTEERFPYPDLGSAFDGKFASTNQKHYPDLHGFQYGSK